MNISTFFKVFNIVTLMSLLRNNLYFKRFVIFLEENLYNLPIIQEISHEANKDDFPTRYELLKRLNRYDFNLVFSDGTKKRVIKNALVLSQVLNLIKYRLFVPTVFNETIIRCDLFDLITDNRPQLSDIHLFGILVALSTWNKVRIDIKTDEISITGTISNKQ